MRASTLFLVTLAILIGLGVAVAAKMTGYFNQPSAPTTPEVQVLVAARNIFEGDVIIGSWVTARALSPSELEVYRQNPKEFLPPVQEAAALRVAKVNIQANQPILQSHLQEMAKPKPLHQRLLTNMRALNLSVSKDRCAGGLIQVGEWVDIHLTTSIQLSGSEETITRTAPIAAGVRVVAKRNALWPVFAPLPDDKPVHFTVEINPYRAALVEFSKSKGYLSLVPVSAQEQVELEGRRDRLLQAKHEAGSDPSWLRVGYQDEEDADRVQLIRNGELTVGHDDLVRIFQLNTPPPPESQLTIDQFTGIKYDGPRVFTAEGRMVLDSRTGYRSAQNRSTTGQFMFQFSAPKCDTCDTAKNSR